MERLGRSHTANLMSRAISLIHAVNCIIILYIIIILLYYALPSIKYVAYRFVDMQQGYSILIHKVSHYMYIFTVNRSHDVYIHF